MRQNEFDRFFDRNTKESIEADLINFNEFGDEHAEIMLFITPYDDELKEFVLFSYDTPEEFANNAKKSTEKTYKIDEIKSLELRFKYYTEDPEDNSVVDVDEI